MKRTLLFLLFPFLFHSAMAQKQNGIVAIARYNDVSPPTLDERDGLPEFEGGIEAFKKAFRLEFTFPQSALDSEKGGEGMIGFTVDSLGNIQDVQVIDVVSPEIDAEAVSVLSAMHAFQPMWKPMKLAVLYNAFPSIYKDELYNKRLEDLIKSKKTSELRGFMNKNKAYVLFSANVGAAVPTQQLNRYLKPLGQLTGNFEIFINRWGGGLSGSLRGGSVRKDFEYDGNYWDKDTTIALYGVGLYAAYRLVEDERLTFTPFVGLAGNFLVLPSDSEDSNAATIRSFLPTIGASVDILVKQKAYNDWGSVYLSTTTVRLHFAVNFANFKDDRRGNLVDLGVGFSWHTRELTMK